MSDPQYTVYDFRQAESTDESANAFRLWIAKASQAFSDHWVGIAGSEGSLYANNIRTQSLESAVENTAASDFCCTFNITDENTQSIWYISEHDAHQIVAELLHAPEGAEIAERPLTDIESVVAKTFFETLAKSVRQGWLGTLALNCDIEAISTNPKRVRLCRGKDLVITGSLHMQLARGETTVHWISKKQEMSELLEQVVDRRASTGTSNDPRATVERLPIEIVGLLGQASIPMRRLASITVGDIVQLDQRIDQPIVASVAGRPFFECWPGKIGKTVGLEISKCIGPNGSAS
ncbi:FliM/FliN family flagellar motor switch protein [Mariniblastus fucicola]|uniref:Flagellar motor switch protein FliM n=1 Tax=Mariniblastus fucicola TaxID=980251 RepID=A0A5B9PCZ3_9BACT|nr:FliM/FliN family flagellar motor switch protein [Mariniblastus fucicola]QEG23389.1 Flagellar motor switch protein FliM [Mariniblastus fucicola]